MKKNSMWIGGVAALLIASQSGWAQGGRLINVENKLRLRYDDNVHQVADNETSSFVVMDDVMINLDKVFEGGFVGLRYRTTFSVYDNRDDADTDWDHNVGLQASRAIGSRLTLAVRDDFSAIDSPQLVREDGTLAREDQSYLYNSFNASLLSVLTPKLNLDLSGRHAFLRYDKDLIANREDYDLVGAGATLRTLISKEMSVFGEVRYESQEYKGVGDIQTVTYYGYRGVAPVAVPDRGSDTISFGLGLNNQFSPNVIGAIRGGYTKKDFDAANTDSESAPYGEISLTVAPTSDTQLTLSGNYSLYQSSLMTYVNQTRSSAAANLSHKLTGKIAAYLGASYIYSEYNQEQSVNTLDPTLVVDGTEKAYTYSAGLTFTLNRMHRLEAGFSSTDLSSDVRDGFTRNQFDLAWSLRF